MDSCKAHIYCWLCIKYLPRQSPLHLALHGHGAAFIDPFPDASKITETMANLQTYLNICMKVFLSMQEIQNLQIVYKFAFISIAHVSNHWVFGNELHHIIILVTSQLQIQRRAENNPDILSLSS